MSDLNRSILNTLAYHDLFDYPLTDFEVWRGLYEPPPTDFFEIRKVLQNGLKEIETHNGFYFLKGRNEIVETRLNRYKIAERKFKRALRFTKWWLRFIPWIKMIAVCNTLGYSNAWDESDIDLFIIASPKKIWLTRFFATLPLKIFGLRPDFHGGRDKLCLTFFISEDHLDISDLKIGESDIYLTFWFTQLTPIYNRNQTYERFWLANAWLKRYLPNAAPYLTHPRRKVTSFYSLSLSKGDAGSKGYSLSEAQSPLSWGQVCHSRGRPALDPIGGGNLVGAKSRSELGIFERLTKVIQLKVLPAELKKMANQDTRVVITDQVLKFHHNDKREEISQKFEARTGPPH